MSELEFFLRHGFDNLHTFRRAELILCAYGFTDSSWHNDTCPSLTLERGPDQFAQVFIESRNPELREGPDFPLASIYLTFAEGPDWGQSFDSVAEAIRYCRANFPKLEAKQ